MTNLTISVTPQDALLDISRDIIVRGLQPDEIVTITARTTRGADVMWESQARFFADHAGTVDLSRDAPVAGDYAEVSPMGLLWSQHPNIANAQDVFPVDVMVPLVTELVAETVTGQVATTQLIQRFAAEGVTRHDIRDEGLVGTVFTPAGEGPFPVVIVLNGSGGGINEPRGALYASHGYQALALGYFKTSGLSPYITATPLEYFEKALHWVKETLKPANDFIAVSGQSRGGELSLMLGSRFPELVSAVIAYVPGAMVHGAQGAADPHNGGWSGPAWTWRGEALEHLWNNNRAVDWHPWDGAVPPNRHHNVFFEGLKDKELAEKSRIPVEQIKAPVLLISGVDDRAWPSSLYSKMVVSSLRKADHPYEVLHLDFDNAGHSINLPFVPSTQITRMHPVSKVPFTSGGNASGNAKADANSWYGVVGFLQRAFQTK